MPPPGDTSPSIEGFRSCAGTTSTGAPKLRVIEDAEVVITVILGLAAALAWAVANLFVARVGHDVSSVVMITWILSVQVVLTVPLALVFDDPLGAPIADYARAAGGGLLLSVGFLAFVHALRVGSLSVVSPIVGLEGGIAALIAVGLGEHLGGLLVAGLALGTAGAVLAASPGGRRVSRGALAASAAAVLFAIQFVLYGKIEQAGPLLTAAVIGIAALVPLTVLAARGGTLELPRSARSLALTAGVLDAAAMVVFAAAQARGPSSVASVTGAQFAVVSALLGVLLLAERPRRHQWLGIGLAAFGTTLLGLGG